MTQREHPGDVRASARRRKPHRKAAAVVGLAAVTLLGLTGCTAEAPTTNPLPSITTSPTPSATTIAEPTRPVDADVETPEGAVTFTRFSIEVINRAYATGDTTQLADISTPDCTACNNLIEDIDAVIARGNMYVGGEVTITDITPAEIGPELIPTVPITVDIDELREQSPTGDAVEEFAGSSDLEMLIDLDFADSEWKLMNWRRADGT